LGEFSPNLVTLYMTFCWFSVPLNQIILSKIEKMLENLAAEKEIYKIDPYVESRSRFSEFVLNRWREAFGVFRDSRRRRTKNSGDRSEVRIPPGC
jgi:hypothetical protein